MLTVHGRTRCQMYNGQANWQEISRVKESVKIPVIANGDIKNSQDAKNALDLSKADGVMIGRACYGKPWLIRQIADELINRPSISTPTIFEQREIVLNHFEEMIEHYGAQTGISLAKKHIGWYSSGLKDSAEFRAKINTMGCFSDNLSSASKPSESNLQEISKIRDTIRKFYDLQLS